VGGCRRHTLLAPRLRQSELCDNEDAQILEEMVLMV
jgi:hypothetical protein